MKKILIFIITIVAFSSCIEDSFDTSPSAQPQFDVEELDMGVQFTDNPSPTAKLMIYNRNSKIINLQTVKMRSGQYFRINVDGQAGKFFNDVEIRPNDSIYVFVECTLPPTPTAEPLWITDDLEVTTNGVLKTLPIKALAQNVERHYGRVVDADLMLTAEVPHVVFDTLRVKAGATLTLSAGVNLLFHDKAALIVEGSLVSQGSAEQPVIMRGDRTGNVVADISYDVMSNQWEGVRFAKGSKANKLSYTEVLNTCQGVRLDSLVEISMVNTRLYNSGATQLSVAGDANVTALGCEISNAASALLLLEGGNYVFNRCTIANWYLFEWPDMAIVEFVTPEQTHATFSNSIIYGRDKSVGDYGDVEAVDIWFKRCLFTENGADDGRYLQCLWGEDPKLDYSLTDYTFDYSPTQGSPTIDAALSEFDAPGLPDMDRRGKMRAKNLGAYATGEVKES